MVISVHENMEQKIFYIIRTEDFQFLLKYYLFVK